MRISDWSSDVCSSDLQHLREALGAEREIGVGRRLLACQPRAEIVHRLGRLGGGIGELLLQPLVVDIGEGLPRVARVKIAESVEARDAVIDDALWNQIGRASGRERVVT